MSAIPAPVVDTRSSAAAAMSPVPLEHVRMGAGFWGDLYRRTIAATLPAQYRQCEETGALANFERAAGLVDGPFRGRYYSDSDVYKWVEAASWACAADPDLAEALERVVGLIEGAQRPDGYINTYFSRELADHRWTNLADMHELYLLGHLTQAAVAHTRATGSERLLRVAERALDHVYDRFPPSVRPVACGHPCLEMASVELYRLTQDERWLELASWQVESRGRGLLDGREYLLDHAPVREQHAVTGHAVRALYLYAGVADLVMERPDPELEARCDEWWEDITRRKISVTHGLGSRWDGEAFGDAYELPDRAYNESCAGIGFIGFAQRMLLRRPRGEYRDAIEETLLNAVLPGISHDGERFFYQNPLGDAGRHRREPWFECACCPPNIARTLVELPGLLAAAKGDAVWINLLATAEISVACTSGTLELAIDSDLPFGTEASIRIVAAPHEPIRLALPDPAWADATTVMLNGSPVHPENSDGYVIIERRWNTGDVLTLGLEAPARLVSAHPASSMSTGRAALVKGPVVYCVEDADCERVDLLAYAEGAWTRGGDVLPGIPTLTGPGRLLDAESERLYAPWPRPTHSSPVQITALPYFAWANRAAGGMRVWLPSPERAD